MAWRSQQGDVELPGAGQRQQEAVILGHTPPGDGSVIYCRVAAVAVAGRISAVLGHARLYSAAGDGRNAGRVWEKAAAAGEEDAAGTAAAGGIAAVAAVDRISPVEAVRHAVVAPNLVWAQARQIWAERLRRKGADRPFFMVMRKIENEERNSE